MKFYRKILDSDVSENAYLLCTWMWLLGRANYEPSKKLLKGQQVEMLPGMVAFSFKEVAKKFDCSRKTISKWCHYLHETKRISLVVSPQGCVATICNWSLYQDEKKEGLHDRASGRASATATGVAHNKEVKKERIKEGKDFSNLTQNEELNKPHPDTNPKIISMIRGLTKTL